MPAIVEEIRRGNISGSTAGVFCLRACALGGVGGALSGALVGGKHIGYGLSALMGTFFGPIASLPGVVLALIALPLS